MTTNTTSKEAADKLREMRDLCDEWAADSTAQAFGTPFNAWLAAKYPARYASNAVKKGAVVTIDTPEFRTLVCLADKGLSGEVWPELLAHIDAKLAQAREEAVEPYSDYLRSLCCSLSVGGWNSEGLMPVATAEAKISDGLDMLVRPWIDRAIAAEKALEAVRRGVDELIAHAPEEASIAECIWNFSGYERCKDDVLALFATPQKSDDSGLPG